jgi:hypothetical protein
MQNRYKVLLFLVLAALWSAVSVVYAQNPLTFDLRMDNPKPISKTDSEEFSLSLDSQLFVANLLVGDLEENKVENIEITDEEVQKLVLKPDVSVDPSLDTELDTSVLVKEPRFALKGIDPKTGMTRQSYVPTLTLTTGYDGLSLVEDSEEGLQLEKKMGKFKIFGKYEQKIITKIPLPEERSSENYSELRGSSFSNYELSGFASEQDKLSALASRYYLEATYSFKPSLTGRIAYKRSMVDTIDSEEKLEFEGVVEANRNVLIKAGYNNETRPEVNEPKATKDSKVWTEFILKF